LHDDRGSARRLLSFKRVLFDAGLFGVGLMSARPCIAVFAATSGHSGVDRIVANLVEQWAAWDIRVDLIQIRAHGPYLQSLPAGVRRIDLGTAHVNTALPALVRYLRRERPTALLTDKDRVNRIAILARWLSGANTKLAVRLGTTVSDNLASRGGLERWLQRTSIRRLYPFAERIIVPSDGVADDLIAHFGVDPGQLRVVCSPIVSPRLLELASRPVQHPWFRPGEPPVILGVGELGARKDFETLIRAFALVRAERPCRLVILGRGRRHDRLRALAAELDVADDIDLPGFRDNPYAFMQKASLFALSSRWEGLGIVLVEALACGTPVVSTDCPSGPREILQDVDHARLVPVGDHQALALAIIETLSSPPDRRALQRRASAFSVEASAMGYLRAMGVDDAVPAPLAAEIRSAG
jgi:glycosyltransferase involved in cell wall biosynthesis